jgi:hypothetical protein
MAAMVVADMPELAGPADAFSTAADAFSTAAAGNCLGSCQMGEPLGLVFGGEVDDRPSGFVFGGEVGDRPSGFPLEGEVCDGFCPNIEPNWF